MTGFTVALSDTLRELGSHALQPRDNISWHRRCVFYFLRTLFEGPTTTFSWLMFLHSILWFFGTLKPTWPLDVVIAQGIARSGDVVIYGVLFMVLTGYQVLCHTVLHCGPVWRTCVAAVVLFIVAQTAMIPILSIDLWPSLVMAGNYTVCLMAFLVLSRSFPTWTSREHFRGRV